jgi:competence protein CoiA
MHFALVDNERTAPSPGLTGSCPACGGATIAKCGDQRIHHWAHSKKTACDSWREPETPWHRTWKNRFPARWQEFIRWDHNGEKHIADVRTERGLTIEFQHSHLRPEERAARENFYGDILWIVDGSRLARDLPRFLDGIRTLRPFLQKGLYIAPFPDEMFPRSWLNCTVPVFFDFENTTDLTEKAMHVRCPLWCLLPGRALGQAVVLKVSRENFVRWTHSMARPIQSQAILEDVARSLAEQRRLAQVASLRAAMPMLQGRWRQGVRRRYARF